MNSKLITVALILLSVQGVAQNTRYQFGRIDMSKGLSNPIVNDIFQDSIGFIWFATASGLNRYDGHSIKVFKNIPGDSTSLDVDNLTGIFEGPEGKLWIRSYYGTVVYNPKTENFDRNIHGLRNDYAYDLIMARSIGVSTAALEQALKVIYPAPALLAELKRH